MVLFLSMLERSRLDMKMMMLRWIWIIEDSYSWDKAHTPGCRHLAGWVGGAIGRIAPLPVVTTGHWAGTHPGPGTGAPVL